MADAPWTGLRVALVHDWLTGMRGGEYVLEAIGRLFPEAEIVTLVHARGSVSQTIERRRIRTSFVQRLPAGVRRYREYLPLFPLAIEQFDLDAVDVIVSVSTCAAKAVVPTGRARHLCYCNSPMRYAWDQFDAYFGPARLGPAGSAAARTVMGWLARWDRATAGRVDRFVANSAHVAGRIARYYNRASSVLHPPVDTAFFSPGGAETPRHFLVVSALVPYKRVDLAIAAAARLDAPLVIVGTGPDDARLRAMAGPNVTFAGRVDNDELRALYRSARALLMPGEEDFGIAPVEAMACGRPVVALGRGGALETVDAGVSGVFVDDTNAEALADAMDRASRASWDAGIIRERALRFSPERFDAGLRTEMTALLSAGPAC